MANGVTNAQRLYLEARPDVKIYFRHDPKKDRIQFLASYAPVSNLSHPRRQVERGEMIDE